VVPTLAVEPLLGPEAVAGGTYLIERQNSGARGMERQWEVRSSLRGDEVFESLRRARGCAIDFHAI
jgi:hypothetical protein